jgi:hypothetical protein
MADFVQDDAGEQADRAERAVEQALGPPTGMKENANSGRKISRVTCTRIGMSKSFPME